MKGVVDAELRRRIEEAGGVRNASRGDDDVRDGDRRCRTRSRAAPRARDDARVLEALELVDRDGRTVEHGFVLVSSSGSSRCVDAQPERHVQKAVEVELVVARRLRAARRTTGACVPGARRCPALRRRDRAAARRSGADVSSSLSSRAGAARWRRGRRAAAGAGRGVRAASGGSRAVGGGAASRAGAAGVAAGAGAGGRAGSEAPCSGGAVPGAGAGGVVTGAVGTGPGFAGACAREECRAGPGGRRGRCRRRRLLSERRDREGPRERCHHILPSCASWSPPKGSVESKEILVRLSPSDWRPGRRSST